MQSLEDENYYKNVLMNNFGVDSESENDSDDDDESGLRLYKDFMVIPHTKKSRLPPTKLLQDQNMNANALLWYKLYKNSEDLLKNKTPLELFTSIWTNDVVSNIADETNILAKQIIKKYQNNGLYANSKLEKWKPTNPNEIYAYLGVLISMLECVKPNIKDYFDSTIKITLTPGYERYITEDRFWLLYNLVHIVDNAWFTETLTNPDSDVLQLVHFMHHFCLVKSDYIKVWHKKRFVNLLNYCLEQTIKISSLNKYTLKSDICDSLLKIYKTEDYVKEQNNFVIREVKYLGDKDFRMKVVNHLPDIDSNNPAHCALCERVTAYFCRSCDVHLCFRVRGCYRRYPHLGKPKAEKDP